MGKQRQFVPWLLAVFLLLQHQVVMGENRPQLLVGYLEFPPYFFNESSGMRYGFSYELIEAIGEEIGVEIVYQDYTDTATFAEATIAGTGKHAIPGVTQIPALEDQNVFSNSVAFDTLRLMTRSADVQRLSNSKISNKKIGITPYLVGYDVSDFLAKNDPVEFANVDSAIISLLAGEIDGVLSVNAVLYDRVRDSKVDDLIGFIDPPIVQANRIVVLHKSQSELLPAINKAIAKMEADGRLAALRAKYFVKLPEPAPEVLRVPAAHLPPYILHYEDGEVSGYAVEVVNDLAVRAGLKIEFLPMKAEDYFKALETSDYDLFPVVSTRKEVSGLLDLTLPIENSVLDVFVRGADQQFLRISDLVTARIGSLPDIAHLLEASGIKFNEVIPITHDFQLHDALKTGEIDALIEVKHHSDEIQSDLELRRLGKLGLEYEIAIGLRPGLGQVRERLNAIIPGYLISDKYSELQKRYFGETQFWTTTRLYQLGVALAAIFAMMAGYLFWMAIQRKQQARELAISQKHTEELDMLIVKLERSNRELDEFAYICSHDLQGPLRKTSTISGFLRTRIEELDPALAEDKELDFCLTQLKKTSENGQELIQSILDYSKLDHDRSNFEPVDCNEIFEKIRNVINTGEGTEFLKINNKLPVISGKETQIYQLFFNLVSNALKYIEPGKKPSVSVVSFEQNDWCVFKITDNGIGIDEKNHKPIFEIFHRLHRKDEYSGVGIGLSTCKKIVDNHHGKIEVKSELGKGSTFVVTLMKA